MTDPTALPPILRRNLALLLAQNRELVERITWPCGSEHVAWTDDGRAAYRVHQSWLPLSLSPEAAADVGLGEEGKHTDVLVFGLGLGEQLEHLLTVLPRARIWAWERDPWLLRQVLDRRDWTAALRRGQLKFLLTSDLLEVARSDRPIRIVSHPLLGDVYRIERALLERRPERIALLAAGGLFVDDVADALVEQGFSPFTWDLERWSREELLRVARQLEPEVGVAINYTHGLAEMCAEVGVPLRVWEIDPSTDVLPPLPGGLAGAPSQNTRLFTFRRANAQAFQNAGFAHADHLPLAANPERRKPAALTAEQQERYGGDVTFVGSSLVEQGLAFRSRLFAGYAFWKGGDPDAAMEQVEAATQRVLDAQRDDQSTYRVPELLQQELGWFVQAFAKDDTIYESLGGASPDALLGEMAAADKRITYVANLGQVGVKVWGDAGWEHVAQYGAQVMGPAGHRDELTAIYSTDAIHVDIGRIYQSDIVTMRVFDVLACGGFCLAEWSEGLEELFVLGEELDAYRSLDELLEKVEYWLEQGPEARRAVGAAGRARVLKDHTIQQRVMRMLGK